MSGLLSRNLGDEYMRKDQDCQGSRRTGGVWRAVVVLLAALLMVAGSAASPDARNFSQEIDAYLRRAQLDSALAVALAFREAHPDSGAPSGVLGMDPYFMLAIYTSQYYRPTGEPAPIWWALSRWQNEEYDALVEQIAPLQADDPKTKELFVQAMEIWLSEMPDVYVAQLIIRYPMNTTYWVGWPSTAAPYGFPHSWQWELLKTFINLEPTQ